MHFSWEKHLELSRNVAVASDKNQGMALALMGVALTMLATDLLAHVEGLGLAVLQGLIQRKSISSSLLSSSLD